MQLKFNSAIVFAHDGSLYRAARHAESDLDITTEAVDPTPTQWGTLGIKKHTTGEFAALLGDAYFMVIEVADRILPGKIIKEHLGKLLFQQEAATGRKPSRKEAAQLRDQVEAQLLPKAFIRRALVPIYVTRTHVVVFTSSYKRANDCMSVMYNLATVDAGIKHVGMAMASFSNSVSAWLLAVARQADDVDTESLMPHRAIVLKNEDTKSTVRYKDHDVEEEDVQALLDDASNSNHIVTELQMACGSALGAALEGVTFSLTNKLILKGIKFPDLTVNEYMGAKAEGDEEAMVADYMGMATLVGAAVMKLFTHLWEDMDGEATYPWTDDEL
jgi:recombination associated protein RdgC